MTGDKKKINLSLGQRKRSCDKFFYKVIAACKTTTYIINVSGIYPYHCMTTGWDICYNGYNSIINTHTERLAEDSFSDERTSAALSLPFPNG